MCEYGERVALIAAKYTIENTMCLLFFILSLSLKLYSLLFVFPVHTRLPPHRLFVGVKL